MWLGVAIGAGSFAAAYACGWLFLNWAFLHKYDETDLSLQVRVSPSVIRTRILAWWGGFTSSQYMSRVGEEESGEGELASGNVLRAERSTLETKPAAA